ncbi:MAG: PspC domain-containing protein [Anaerolineaceae bacterium]|nr:PspC domain-containing protein [Anaerolineaceae bacterium]
MDEPKKLYRNTDQSMIGGVCAGLADYLNADPTLIRLLFVFLALTGTAGFWVYLVMWIVVPARHGEA